MSIIISKKVMPKRKIEKSCHFPECTCKFMGIGPSKYCEEHKKLKYRKTINKILNKRKEAKRPKIDNANQIIKSVKNSDVYIQECACTLEGCDKKFEVTIIPRTMVYPQYCPEHRNQFKRELFLKGVKQ